MSDQTRKTDPQNQNIKPQPEPPKVPLPPPSSTLNHFEKAVNITYSNQKVDIVHNSEKKTED